MWIGGEKRSSIWYWTGMITGRIPENGTPDSGWHGNGSGHSDSAGNDCLYYQTSTNPSNVGWNAHYRCTTALKYICEKSIFYV